MTHIDDIYSVDVQKCPAITKPLLLLLLLFLFLLHC